MKKILIILFLTLSVGTQAQDLKTTISKLMEPEKVFPDDILDLLVVNNSVPQAATFGHSASQNQQALPAVEIDLSTAASHLLFATTRTLEQGRIFASVGLLPHPQNRTNDFLNMTRLTTPQVDSLCREYMSDAVLSCNRIVVYDVMDVSPFDDYNYYAYLQAYVVVSWSLDYPDGWSETMVTRDTLLWEGLGATAAEALSFLPDRQTALLDMCEYSGEKFAKQFVPQWIDETRYLYEDPTLAEGMNAFVRKRWTQAIDAWTTVYNQYKDSSKRKDKMIAAKSAANIAVACEFNNDMERAHTWANKAVDAFLLVGNAEGRQQAVNVRAIYQ